MIATDFKFKLHERVRVTDTGEISLVNGRLRFLGVNQYNVTCRTVAKVTDPSKQPRIRREDEMEKT